MNRCKAKDQQRMSLFDEIAKWIRGKKKKETKAFEQCSPTYFSQKKTWWKGPRYKNWINKRVWLPVFHANFCETASGTKYETRDDGWRRA